MNIFILSTGRCGSTSFARACAHIQNYSSAHESRAHQLGAERLRYPEQHIESDNRLSFLLGRLHQHYPDPQQVYYVHLLRERQATIQSYAKRLSDGMILPAWARGIHLHWRSQLPTPSSQEAQQLAADYIDSTNANIEQFLHNKANAMTCHLDNIDHDFRQFWHTIQAQGPLHAALAEFKQRHNAS